MLQKYRSWITKPFPRKFKNEDDRVAQWVVAQIVAAEPNVVFTTDEDF